MSTINKQVKQIVKSYPHYLGDCLIVNNCTELRAYGLQSKHSLASIVVVIL